MSCFSPVSFLTFLDEALVSRRIDCSLAVKADTRAGTTDSESGDVGPDTYLSSVMSSMYEDPVLAVVSESAPAAARLLHWGSQCNIMDDFDTFSYTSERLCPFPELIFNLNRECRRFLALSVADSITSTSRTDLEPSIDRPLKVVGLQNIRSAFFSGLNVRHSALSTYHAAASQDLGFNKVRREHLKCGLV